MSMKYLALTMAMIDHVKADPTIVVIENGEKKTLYALDSNVKGALC